MRDSHWFALTAACLVVSCVLTAGQSATFTLSIVGTNDVHGGIVPVDGRGGLALLGGYVNNLRAARARDGGGVLLIDAGDMWQGTLESNLTEGASVVAGYNALGYAAAAIGNHEFDFGPVGPLSKPGPGDDPRGSLKVRAAEARFPFLAANLIDRATGRPVSWPNVRPSVIVDATGIKVGIVGVMTANALAAIGAALTPGLSVAPIVDAVVPEARRLRSAGATIVVVAAHAGARCGRYDNPRDLSSCDNESEIIKVARGLPRGLVDVILAGHVHAVLAHEIADIPVVSTSLGLRAFSRVDLTVDRRSGRVTGHRILAPRDLCARESVRTQACVAGTGAGTRVAQYEGASVHADDRIARVLAPAVDKVAALKAMPVGVFADAPVRRAGDESPLGNLVTDAMLAAIPGADVAINNTIGGLRADLPRGPVTYGRVYEVLPFDNRVVAISLTGAELKAALAARLRVRSDPMGIAGIRVHAVCAGGAIQLSIVRASGVPVRDGERLRVATSDFIATGGGVFLPRHLALSADFQFPSDAPVQRDVIVDWLRARGGELREDALVDRDNPRWTYSGRLPLRCTR